MDQIPKINPTDLYPTPTHGPLSQSDASLTEEPYQYSISPSLHPVVLSRIFHFFVLFGIFAIVGLIFGVTIGQYLIKSTGYFSELSNASSYLIVVTPLTLIFGFIGRSIGQIKYVAYPFVAFTLASSIRGLEVLDNIRALIPMNPVNTKVDGTDFVSVILIVCLSYVATYLIDVLIFSIIDLTKTRLAKGISGITVMVLTAIFLVVILPGVGKSLLRERGAIRVPETQELFGLVNIDLYDQKGAGTGFEIIYAKPTQQYDGNYQMSDSVHVKPINKWWAKDTPTNCYGSGYTLSQKSYTNQYLTTPKGNQYAKSQANTTTSYYTNVRKDINEFTEFRYCFVVGNMQYILLQSNKLGDAYLDKYRADSIIDTIYEAATYYPHCTIHNRDIRVRFATNYCTDADTQSIQNLNQRNHNKNKNKRPE